MNGKLRHLAAALLPICFLSAQQPGSQVASQPSRKDFRQPSPEAMRHAAELRRNMAAHAIAINDLAGRIHSLEDARKLVDMVAGEFPDSLPPKWATYSIRDRLARAEYESAVEPGSLISEQHVADVWNDYLQTIGAPQESYVTAAEIHTLRDSYYVTSQLSWARGNQNIWTVSNIYAIGADGKVANGCRAIEALNILWQLSTQPEILQGTRDLIKQNQRLSEIYKHPSKPPAPGTEKAYVTIRTVPPNPIELAANHYMHKHGADAMYRAIVGLVQDLFAG